MGRHLLPRLALSLGVVVFCLLGMELTLRLIRYDPLGQLLKGKGELLVRRSDRADLRYELTPNAEAQAWGAFVKVNSHGFRDQEYSLAKGESYRIVVLGDSVTFGNMLPAEDTFPEQLERSLNDRFERRVDILNLGVGGYDIVQEVASLNHLGLKFSPDLVIVGFCTNDVGDSSLNLKYLERTRTLDSPIYRFKTAQLALIMTERLRALYSLFLGTGEAEFYQARRDYILRIDEDEELMGMIDSLRERSAEAESERSLGFLLPPERPLEWYTSEAHIGMLEFAFAWLSRLQAKHGFKVVVAIIPKLQENESYEIVHRIISHEAHKFGLVVVDLASAFAAADYESLRIRSHDLLHTNEKGHGIIARSLEETLLSAGLLAEIDGNAGAESPPQSLRP